MLIGCNSRRIASQADATRGLSGDDVIPDGGCDLIEGAVVHGSGLSIARSPPLIPPRLGFDFSSKRGKSCDLSALPLPVCRKLLSGPLFLSLSRARAGHEALRLPLDLFVALWFRAVTSSDGELLCFLFSGVFFFSP